VPRSVLAFLLSLLPKSLLSSWVGRVVHAPLPPPVARRSVALFARWYQINLAEAELPLAHYPTIGALFSRRLKPGVRPLGPGPVHPADALITVSGPIDQHTLLQGKGHTYTLEELVHNPQVASHFAQGSFLTYYLCPTDYHRVHAPVAGAVTWSCHIPGAFWPVNAWGVRQVPKLFCVNERVVTLLQTSQGPVAVVMIAAMHVGQITLAYDTSITTTKRGPRRPITETVYTPPQPLRKGAELGIFHMGSTVIVLFAPGVLSIDVGPLQGRRVHMGEALHTSA
jgi:phosphatidylserine decarboxylase